MVKEFRIVSDPTLYDEYVVKKFERPQTLPLRRRKRNEGAKLVKEFVNGENFLVEKTYQDGLNIVTLSLVDSHPDDDHFYTLTVTNGLGDPFEVSFDSRIATGLSQNCWFQSVVVSETYS